MESVKKQNLKLVSEANNENKKELEKRKIGEGKWWKEWEGVK